MKNLLTIVALLVTAHFAFAQTEEIQRVFKAQHPYAAGATWSVVDAGLYKVTYMEDGVKRVEVYNKDMQTVWKRSEVKSAALPDPVIKYLEQTVPGQNVPVLVLDENGKSIYYTSDEKQKKTFYLDAQGRVVKTVYESKEYPKSISTYYTQKYPDENAYTVYSEDANGNVSYYTVRKGKMIYFDKDGNYIREDYYYDYDYK